METNLYPTDKPKEKDVIKCSKHFVSNQTNIKSLFKTTRAEQNQICFYIQYISQNISKLKTAETITTSIKEQKQC